MGSWPELPFYKMERPSDSETMVDQGPMCPLRSSSRNIHEPRFWARGSNPRIIRTVEGVIIVTAIFLLVVEVIVNGGLNSIVKNGLTPELPLFAVFTLGRMTIAYALALAFALSYGIATVMSHRASHVLLPLLDIFQSVPVLGYLPIVFAIFLGSGTQANPFGLQIAAIILIFTAMAWSPTFGVIAGINAIPADIKEASRAYGLRGVRYLRQIVLPAVYPELIWTSILAWGSGWYLIPIEEYVPFKGSPVSAGGLGSYIAQASAHSDLASALLGLIILVGMIYAIDQLVWRPLGARAEKYKYESVAAPRTTATPRSVVSEGVKRYEDRIVSPVRTFYKSQRSIVTRALEVVRVTKLLHVTERLRFPERISRIPFWGRLLSYAIFLGLVAFGLELLIAPRSVSIVNALTILAANVSHSLPYRTWLDPCCRNTNREEPETFPVASSHIRHRPIDSRHSIVSAGGDNSGQSIQEHPLSRSYPQPCFHHPSADGHAMVSSVQHSRSN
ncbi:ABC transporter permease subunit [Candidatus Bathyarchaeota archaeon]|nr:MAG: ABC transporter permease subunit [Candidatus Bathyarchaeota archaeon]